MIHPQIQAVTERIIARSKTSRELYLKQMQEQFETTYTRSKLHCGNQAHAFAGCNSTDKQMIAGESTPNIGLVTAYNDMLSAHKTYENYPDMLRAYANKYNATVQVAGGVPAMCDGVTQGQIGMELSLFSRDIIGLSTVLALSHNMFDALMAQIPTSNIKKADLEAFDEALLNGEHLPADVRKNPAQFARAMQGLDQWPGIENAKAASEYARPKAGKLNGGHRSLIVDFMDKSRWRDRGFPEVGVTRAAITDPELKGISGNLLGHRVVKLSSKDSEQPELFDHSTYEKPSFGEYVGDVPLTQRHYVMPDVVEKMIANPTQKGQVVHPYSEDAMGRSTARKLFEEQKQVQPVNQRMLDSVMTGMENQEKYGMKKGGKVRSALMIAKGLKKR
jgi:hypothetical protein